MADFGSPMDAFNMGRAGGAANSSAVGMAIRQIVEQGNKLSAVQAQSGAQTAGSIATSQFKNQLENRPRDVLVQRPGGGFDFVEGVVGGKQGIMGAAPQTSIPQAVGGELQKGFAGPPTRYNNRGEPLDTPAPAPGGSGNLGARDPDAELTLEEEARIRAEMGLPPR